MILAQKTLRPARLVKRYKRYLADIIFDDAPDDIITAHCPNPGAMTGLQTPGIRIYVSPVTSKNAKLPWRWTLATLSGATLAGAPLATLAGADTTMVGIDTGMANDLAHAILDAGHILEGITDIKREVKWGDNTRFDFCLSVATHEMFLEVKSVTLAIDQDNERFASFPDAKTARGLKHMNNLCEIVKNGQRAGVLYIVQRDDCAFVTTNATIDPAYAQACAVARDAGVEFFAASITHKPDGTSHLAKILDVR